MPAVSIDPNGQFITEPERKITVTGQAQVLVVGGGIAGTGAALAAARCGARTLVIERDGYLGGTGTTGLMSLITLPYERLYGICRELVDGMADRGGAVRGPVIPFEPETFKRVALAKFLEASIDMRFYTWTVDAIVVDGKVRGVIVDFPGNLRFTVSVPTCHTVTNQRTIRSGNAEELDMPAVSIDPNGQFITEPERRQFSPSFVWPPTCPTMWDHLSQEAA